MTTLATIGTAIFYAAGAVIATLLLGVVILAALKLYIELSDAEK